MRPSVLRRALLAAIAGGLAAGLGACSGGIDRSEYTMPIAANEVPAPTPVVPVASPGAGLPHGGRLPLLPPVPEEQSGLPPVTMAQLMPPPVR
jgi:hypothetical protein